MATSGEDDHANRASNPTEIGLSELDAILLDRLRDRLQQVHTAFRSDNRWKFLRMMLVSREGAGDPGFATALLVGLRSCQEQIWQNQSGQAAYLRVWREHRTEPGRETEVDWRLATTLPYREMQALLVLGYCQRMGDAAVNWRRLRSFLPAIERIEQRAPSPVRISPNLNHNPVYRAWRNRIAQRLRALRRLPNSPVETANQRARAALRYVQRVLAPQT